MQTLSIKNARRLETEIIGEVNRLTSRLNYSNGTDFNSREQAEENTLIEINTLVYNIAVLREIKFDIRKQISLFNVDDINNKTVEIAKLVEELSIL